MNLEKLQEAKARFERLRYAADDLNFLEPVPEDIFNALLPTEVDGSIESATDGRITAEPFYTETRRVVRVLKNVVQENSRNVLAEIMADGCDPKPTVSLDFETRSSVPLVDAAEDESQIPAIKRLYQNRRTLGTAPKRSKTTRRKGVQ